MNIGLLGTNIEHSLSPMIHNWSAKLLGISDQYQRLNFQHPEFECFWQKVTFDQWRGFNVTSPYKEQVLSLDGVVANEIIGGHGQIITSSCNLICSNPHGGWLAKSCDGEGFARSLRRKGYDLAEFGSLLLLGNGGAARAIVEYLGAQKDAAKPRQISIVRRDPSYDAIMVDCAAHLTSTSIRCIEVDGLDAHVKEQPLQNQGPALLINTLPASVPAARFMASLEQTRWDLVCDLNYQQESKWQAWADEQNRDFQDGLPMLIEQALLSQQQWWSHCAEYDEVFAALRQQLPELKL